MVTKYYRWVYPEQRGESVGNVVVKFKLLTPTAMMVQQSTIGSSGIDLFVDDLKRIEIVKDGIYRFPTGVAVEIPHGYEGQIRTRSSVFCRGINVMYGTVDSDYRGELCVVASMDTDTFYTIEYGDRLAQMIIAKVPSVILEETDELTDTSRGVGGFGSTGR